MTNRQSTDAPHLIVPLLLSCPLTPDEQGIVLPASLALSSLPESLALYHIEYGRRHPLGTYNISLNTIGERGLRLCTLLASQYSLGSDKASTDNAIARDLLALQDSFLDAAMEHLEDCRGILASFFPKSTSGDNAHVSWYTQQVIKYRDHIANIVNHIKHKQGRLRLVLMRAKQISIAGYYVEEVKPDGAIGPHSDLHKGGHTAYSFARNIRYHAAEIVHVSVFLAHAINEIVARPSLPIIRGQPQLDIFSEFLRAVVALPSFVFPDEVLEDWPLISFPRPRGRHRRECRIEYPAMKYRPVSFTRGEFTVSVPTDATSRAFQMPYLGTQGWEHFAQRNPAQTGLFQG